LDTSLPCVLACESLEAHNDDNRVSKMDTCAAFVAKRDFRTMCAAVDAAAMPDAPDAGDPVT